MSGEITDLRKQQWRDGTWSPQLVLDTGDGAETLVSAGPAVLLRELRRLKPRVGDHVTIVYTGTKESRGGFAPAKVFEVKIDERALF